MLCNNSHIDLFFVEDQLLIKIFGKNGNWLAEYNITFNYFDVRSYIHNFFEIKYGVSFKESRLLVTKIFLDYVGKSD